MDEHLDSPVAGPSSLPEPPVEEAEETEMLARRRSRRSTAGNRYEAAKAEMGLEDDGIEMEPDPDKDDVEFVVVRDEEDVFDNDFASTDEDEEQMDGTKGEMAEKEAREDERPARKSARSRVAQQTALAAARHQSTFQPPTTTTSTPKTKRVRLVLGPSSTTQGKKGIRQSSRTSTIQVRSETSRRLREGARKTRLRRTLLHLHQQAHDPSSSGMAEGGVRYSQAELIQRALDNEEGNIRSHQEYLAVEEEKRRKATVVRRVGVEREGVRWVSRAEKRRIVPEQQKETTPKKQQQPSASGFVLQLAPEGYAPPPPPSSSPQANMSSADAETVTEKQTHNYLLHSLSLSSPSAAKPTWSQTMSALFGSHVDWSSVRVWPSAAGSRGRPLSRPIPKCVITGLPAKYVDPRTGCPYADAEAFRVLTKVLEHEYVWSTDAKGKGGVYLSVLPPVPASSAARKNGNEKGKEKMVEVPAEKTGTGTAEEPIEIDMHMDVEVEEGIVRRALKAAA